MKNQEKTKAEIKKIQEKSRGFRKEFITFINRGNVMDLAVGVVVGSAFTAIVNSLVNDIIMPTVSLIGGGFDFASLSLTINEATINYGNFIQNVANFLIIALVVFLMIKFINKIHEKAEKIKIKTTETNTK